MSEIKAFILSHIQEEYPLPPDADVDSFNFIRAGYIDSVGIIRFVALAEDTFGVTFADEELIGPAFQTIGALESLIRQKMEQSHEGS